MERATSHQIDAAAEAVFNSAIPIGWVARKETPDYGIDFMVHIFDPKHPGSHENILASRVPSSERFAVQVKGIVVPQGNVDVIQYRLKTNPLEYYVDVEPHPVYLVVVDVTRKEAFWLFVQEYADDQLGKVDWRRQEKVTIDIPRSNRFICDDAFRNEVLRATQYMVMRNPRRISLGIIAEQRRLASLDPRFDVKIDLDDAGMTRTFHLKPSASLSTNFKFSGDSERSLAFARGKAVPFSPGEIVVDSPLFDEAQRQGGHVRVGKQLDATVILTAPADVATQLFVVGSMTIGTGGGSFEARPGVVQLKFQFSYHGKQVRESATVWLDMTRWYGKPILELERFEEIDRFFGRVASKSVAMQWIVDGIPGSMSTAKFHKLSDTWTNLLFGTRKAREIARKLGVSPVLPEGFGEDDKVEIDKIHALLFDGEYRKPAPQGFFKITTSRERSKALIEHVERNRSEIAMTGSFPEEALSLDCPVVLPLTEVILTHVRLDRTDIVRKKSTNHVFSGTSMSEIIYRGTKELLSVEDSDRRFGLVPPRAPTLTGEHLDPTNKKQPSRGTAKG